MKPSNEQLLMIYANALSALCGDNRSSPTNVDIDIASDVVQAAKDFAATLPDSVSKTAESETQAELSGNPGQVFEVGGTCDQGEIILIWRSAVDDSLRITLKDDNGRPMDIDGSYEITNYKPPVRVRAWCARNGNTCKVTNSHAEASQFGLTEYGYWTPEVKS